MTFTLATRVTGDASDAARAFQQARTGVDRLGREFSAAGTRAAALARQIGALAGISGGIGLGALGVSTVRVTLEIERLERRLAAAFGGQQAANREMQFASDLARRLGTDLIATVNGYSRFAVAARGTALEGEAARRTFEGLVVAVSGLGLSAEEQAGAIVAFEQILSKGKVAAEELRIQLGQRLPGAFQVAARAMGVTTAELDKMLEQGQLAADDFLPRFAAQLEKEFGRAAAAASTSFDAQANRLNAFRLEVQSALGREFVDFASAAFAELDQRFGGSAAEMEAAARELGRQFVQVMQDMATGAARVVDRLTPLAQGLGSVMATLLNGFNSLPSFMQEIGIVGGLLLGRKGQLAILGLSFLVGFLESLQNNSPDAEAARITAARDRAQQDLARLAGRTDPTSAARRVGLERVIAEFDARLAGGGADAGTGGPIETAVADLFASAGSRLTLARTAAADNRQPNALGGSGGGVRSAGGGGGGGGSGGNTTLADLQRRHEQTARAIQVAYERTLDPVAQAEAAAARFRAEALAGLDRGAAGFNDLVTKIDAVSEAIRRQPHAEALQEVQRAFQDVQRSTGGAVAAANAWRRQALADVDAAGEGFEDFAEQVEAVFQVRLREAYEEDLRNRRDWVAGVERGLRRVAGDSKDTATLIERSVTQAFSGLEDALVSLNRNGARAFKDLINGILVDLERLAIRQTITGPLAQILLGSGGGRGGGGGLLGGLLGGAGGLLGGLLGGSGGLFGGTNAGTSASGFDPLAGDDNLVGGLFSGVGDFFAGLFADGGRIPAGKFGIVGEEGPEIAAGPATITPLDRLSGGTNVTINLITQGGGIAAEQPRVRQGAQGLEIDLLVRQIDDAIGERLRQGVSQTGRAAADVFGLQRGRGVG